MRKFISVLAAASMALSLAACGSSSSSAAASPAASAAPAASSEAAPAASSEAAASGDLTEVDVVLDWYPNAVHSFLYYADVKGYFADEGLKVNLINPADSVDAITFVATGKAQIGLSYPADVITAYANEGMPVKAIGALSQSDMNCMASLKENSITEDMTTLKGKTIGHSGTGADVAEIDCLLNGAGLTEDDVQIVDVGFDLVTSLTTGNADLIVGPFINDEIVTMRNAGYDLNVYHFSDYGMPEMYGLIFVANSDAMTADPDLYDGFLRACRKGFDDMKADEDACLELIMSEMNSDDNPLDEVQQRESYEILLPMMQPEGSDFLEMSEERWQGIIDWMAENSLIDKACTAAEIEVEPNV